MIRGCSSVTIGGMYKRLLRRCLTSMIASLNSGGYASTPTNPSPEGCPSKETFKPPYEVLCCAGCGISELAWSIVFEEIGVSIVSPSSASCRSQVISNPLTELIATVAQKLKASLSKITSENGQSLSLASLCHQISQSYLEIPLLLLANQHRVNFPAAIASFPVRRELLLWKENLKGILFGGVCWSDALLPPHCFVQEPFKHHEEQGLKVYSLGEAFFDGTLLSCHHLL